MKKGMIGVAIEARQVLVPTKILELQLKEASSICGNKHT